MDLLTLSQIIFNFTATALILVVGTLVGMIAYEVISTIMRIKKFSHDVNEKSAEVFRRIDAILAGIAVMPFISKLFKKKSNKKNN